MKKVELGNRIYNVITLGEYTDQQDLHSPKFTAIEHGRTVLPLRSKTDSGPGVYYQPNGMVAHVVKPSAEEADKYSTDRIIDYSNASSIGDVIRNNQIIKDIQSEIMINSEDKLQLNIGDADTPEMKAMKMAINAKQVDKKNYEDRFPQFQNDMRLLKGNSITLAKIISICDAFDISATLTLSDKDDNVPNPMNNSISIDLTEGRPVK